MRKEGRVREENEKKDRRKRDEEGDEKYEGGKSAGG